MSAQPKLSPLDVYKILSVVVFLGVGGFFLYIGCTKKESSTWLVFGVIVLAYALFRVFIAVQTIRKILKPPPPPPPDDES